MTLMLDNTSHELRIKHFVPYVPGTPVVGFDLDEVIWNVNHSYLEEINILCGTSYTVADLHTYSMSNALGVDISVIRKVLHETDAFKRITMCQYSPGIIQGFRDGSLPSYFGLPSVPHHVVMITHRGYRPDGFRVAYELLEQNGILPDTLIASPLGSSKLDIADDIFGEDFSLMFEDHPDTIAEFMSAGIPTVKSLRPWTHNVSANYAVDLNVSCLPIR